jgi:hypothetical protein
MKYVLLLFSIFILASCQPKEDPKLSSRETSIQSLNTDMVFVEGETIYIEEGMIQSEFVSLVEAIDGSRITFRFLTNDGQVKTKTELFQYEKVEVTSENGVYKRVYTLFYFYNE